MYGDTLLNRLEHEFGITAAPLNWIDSYLSGRIVSIGKSTSTAVPVSSDVPQGSVRGPILFTTYIAPVGRLINSHGISYHKYADDSQLYTAFTAPCASSNLDCLARCTTELH